MAFKICRYIKTNGLQCRSPQMTGLDYCYYHNRIEHSHYGYRHANIGGRGIKLGPTEDREAVQLAISNVINALATDQIETKRAMALLYGLQLASNNAARLPEPASYKEIVLEADPDQPSLAPEGAVSTQDEKDEAERQRILRYFEDDDEDEDDED